MTGHKEQLRNDKAALLDVEFCLKYADTAEEVELYMKEIDMIHEQIQIAESELGIIGLDSGEDQMEERPPILEFPRGMNELPPKCTELQSDDTNERVAQRTQAIHESAVMKEFKSRVRKFVFVCLLVFLMIVYAIICSGCQGVRGMAHDLGDFCNYVEENIPAHDQMAR